ncbi:flagellar basal-body rod modification protein FlgD [Mariprofundus micogutta]|uniref:Basal-body rod modification protein FlgD n=1 Tax=Mariprofundus micogutta TaxID=1921010 RepID=A0A1L8CM68_9PROT|nr:flagellar hook capping FlgD N-terminal domain-containing protein [Mariprofundus micogutta]GAV20001.1 flagellar basal-body rod modification protein FlgD [Mariprofundus micogutta]
MLTPTISPTANAANIDNTKKNDLGQKDIFLKLLVAQMEHQDPLKPQDATQMSSQLAQFNMVEQQTESNKLLQQLVAAGGVGNNAAPVTSGADYLGHNVTVNQNQILYNGTNQTFSAVLDEPSSDAMVYIFNSNGEPVKTMPMANMVAGSNQIVWDGTMDSGAQAPQGYYTVDISALNLNGGTIASSVHRSGVVEAVRFSSGGTELIVGGVSASLNEITEIRL